MDVQKFLDKVSPEPNSGCWLWSGGVQAHGYGKIKVHGRYRLAHRVSHEIFVHPVPDGMCVCHACDVTCCVNPSHLFLGTPADNAADRDKKKRHVFGQNVNTAKLTDRMVILVPQLLDIGLTQREIARTFDVSQSTISAIAVGRTWKELVGAETKRAKGQG